MSGRRESQVMALITLLLIAAAEALTAWVHPLVGASLYGVLVVGLFLAAGLQPAAPERRLAVALMLIPLMRVLGLMMPLALFPVSQRYLLVIAPMLVAVPMYLYYQRIPTAEVGLGIGRAGALATYLPVALTGLPFGILEDIILRPAPFAILGLAGGASVVALALAVGFLEELLLRGVVLSAAAGALGEWAGIGFVSVLYVALQAGYNSWPHALLSLIVGVFFGWVVRRTHTIYPVSLAHGFANMIIFGLRPL